MWSVFNVCFVHGQCIIYYFKNSHFLLFSMNIFILFLCLLWIMCGKLTPILNTQNHHFSYTFEKVQENSEKIWHFEKYRVLSDYEWRIPAPINLFFLPYRLTCRRKGMCFWKQLMVYRYEGIRQSGFKVEILKKKVCFYVIVSLACLSKTYDMYPLHWLLRSHLSRPRAKNNIYAST